ncbi:MAG TPA: histidine kinase, partial [Flavipsychrobacter sp.]|nr:histidine kinase [Flavipsychrobacter sp.]
MRNVLIILASLLMFGTFAIGQTHSINTLKTKLALTSDPHQKLAFFLTLCDERNSLSADTLFAFAANAKSLAASLNKPDDMLRADYFIGCALEKKGLLDSAYYLVENSLSKLSNNKNKSALRSKFLYLKGSLLVRKNDFKNAHEVFFTLLKFSEQNNDTINLITARHAIGWVYLETNQASEALLWFRKTLQTAPTNEYEKYYAATYANMIATHGMLEHYDSAQHYIDVGIRVAKKYEQLTILCNILNLKASLYMMTARNHLADAPLKEALEIRKQIGDPFYVVADMAQLASYYANAGKVDEALRYSKEGVEIAEKNQIIGKLPILYHALAHSYKLKGDLKNAIAALEKNIAVKDSLYQVNTTAAMAELETKYQLQKKENTIILQDIKLIKRGYQLAAAAIFIVLSLIISYFVFKNYKAKQKVRLAAALEEEKIMAALAVKEAEETERRRIAADLHDNLGAYAASIAYNLESITHNTNNGNRALTELRNNSEAIVTELSDTIWALKKDALCLTAIS